MPRLSVDIDLTYVPIEDRAGSLANIKAALAAIQQRVHSRKPDVRVRLIADKAKLLCSHRGTQIKIEVNTTMRGALDDPQVWSLSQNARQTYDRFVDAPVIPIGQLYGGKICAALDRQHPRDLFDIKYMLDAHGFSTEIRRGFLFCLTSGDRPLHEILMPTLLDQRETLENHFLGMTDEPWTYEQYEETRLTLIRAISAGLDEADRQFLISFKEGAPEWTTYGFTEFEGFPAVRWKLENIRKLKKVNPSKHRDQLDALKAILDGASQSYTSPG
jgi:hypothetical protein